MGRKQSDGKKAQPVRGEGLKMRGVGKKVFGDAAYAMLLGIGISSAVAEIGKAVFSLYFQGKLRHACHDRCKEIAGR